MTKLNKFKYILQGVAQKFLRSLCDPMIILESSLQSTIKKDPLISSYNVNKFGDNNYILYVSVCEGANLKWLQQDVETIKELTGVKIKVIQIQNGS